MKELIVVTYKLPADAWMKKMYGHDVEHIYDCQAFWDDELSKPEITKLKRKYTEVDSFTCSFAAYSDWIDNEAAYEDFVTTGVCPLKPVTEDVEVGTDSKTVNIVCNLRIERTNPENTFEYKIDLDDVGQIVFTPYDVGTRFCHEGEDVEEGENIKFETVNLTAQMISDVDNYDYFMGTDDIGQFVITPEREETSFLSVSVNNSLNLVTESAEECGNFDIGDRVIVHFNGNDRSGEIIDYVDHDPMDDATGVDSGEFDAWIVKFDDGTQEMIGSCYLTLENLKSGNGDADMKFLKEADNCRDFDWTDDLWAVIKADGSYAGIPCRSYDEARQLAYHPGSKIFKLVLESDSTEEPIEEDLSAIDRSDIVTKVMRGDLPVFSGEGSPESGMIHIEELDNKHGKFKFEYYYDEESNSVISYAVPLRGLM